MLGHHKCISINEKPHLLWYDSKYDALLFSFIIIAYVITYMKFSYIFKSK